MPVDGPSYLVGRTDKRVLTMFCSGTKNQCLWTGPKVSTKTFFRVFSCSSYVGFVPVSNLLDTY